MKFKFIYLIILFTIISSCKIQPIEPLESWIGSYNFEEFVENPFGSNHWSV